MPAEAKLILLRHGQSEWNKQGLFTGWVDIPLTLLGIEEATAAGKKIAHLPIDQVFVSTLIRAQMTATLAMAYHESKKTLCFLHTNEEKEEAWSEVYNPAVKKELIPVIKAWELNERMYGKLQGLNKKETEEKFGKEQVHIWRRSYDVAPPEGESLAMTAARTIPYFKEKILPFLKAGKHVLVVAHGNSLRSIMMHLDGLSKEEVVHLELPTGAPVIYTLRGNSWSKDA